MFTVTHEKSSVQLEYQRSELGPLSGVAVEDVFEGDPQHDFQYKTLSWQVRHAL